MADDVTRQFDVIIVNYKAYRELSICLEGLITLEGRLIRKIIVVDNESDPVTVSRLKAQFKGIDLLPIRTNLGFARGVNLGLKQSKARYILILNPDTRPKTPFLHKAQSLFASCPDVAVIGPRIEDKDGGLQGSGRLDPGLHTAFFGRTSAITRLFPRNPLTRRNVLLEDTEQAPISVDWVSGACMLVRRDAIEEVGLMDERFFMYWEDCDWCRRLRMKGWKVIYHPGMGSIIHRVGKSSRKRPLFSLYHFHRSAILLYAKYDKSPLRMGTLVAIIGGIIRFGVLGMLHTSSSFTKSMLHVTQIDLGTKWSSCSKKTIKGSFRDSIH